MTAPSPQRSAGNLLRRAIERIDERYRKRLQLTPVGPLLYVGLERHEGASFALPDGTVIGSGELVGRLHFNNARAAAVEATSRGQAGIRFARLLRNSFAELAQRSRDETQLHNVQLFEGITWLRAHGRGVGFAADPLPQGPRLWLLSAYFRLLIWAFAPVATRAAMNDVRPHRFRISRRALQESFGSTPKPQRNVGGDATVAARIA